jgi:hypothetical protein
VVMLLTNLH